MKDFNSKNYTLNPYYVERVFWFIYGLYYDGTLLEKGSKRKLFELEESLNYAFANGVAVAVSTGEMDLIKYDLNPYKIKSARFMCYEALYYEDVCLWIGGITSMVNMRSWMNGAHLNGICHAIVQNS